MKLYVAFEGKFYPYRKVGGHTVGTIELENLLINEDGSFVSELAEKLDAFFGYYVPEKVLTKASESRLLKYIRDKIDNDITIIQTNKTN